MLIMLIPGVSKNVLQTREMLIMLIMLIPQGLWGSLGTPPDQKRTLLKFALF